ncbi:hypothetical protein ACFOHT_24925 [Massilia oculi]|uniref:hypothetical protein n=1 Tax=Massilia oculi TaxID=945844 RepID=UPI0013B431FE|nr:hypothetical protein [Massilia oculi]
MQVGSVASSIVDRQSNVAVTTFFVLAKEFRKFFASDPKVPDELSDNESEGQEGVENY